MMAADVTSPIAGENDRPKRKRWYAQLWIQVALGMIAGILLGIFSPRIGARMEPLGDAFIKAIRMLIGPIIFCNLVHGIARMVNVARVGRLTLRLHGDP